MVRQIGRWLLTFSCVMGLSSASTETCTAEKPPCRSPFGTLVFADDFRTVDLGRWMTTYPWGGRNLAGPGGMGELQMYVDRDYKHLGLNPFSIKLVGFSSFSPGCGTPISADETARPASSAKDMLVIRADRADQRLVPQLDGRTYTSGLLTTFNSYSQTYGYFEMRARLPYGRGLWPAFWLLPADRSWPPEIDIMEELGDQPNTLHVTVHRRGAGGRDKPTGFDVPVTDMSAGFHCYGLLWTPRFLAWYFDDRRVAFTGTPRELNRPMYLLVNLAVGGKWAGAPDDRTHFPADMQIDYIRVYRLQQ